MIVAFRGSRAFTLIEVLVALAILAVALSAGMRALAQTADGVGTLRARTLALWVAQNRLALAQFADAWPAQGTTQGVEQQAGTPLLWREAVTATANPAFRRIDIVVSEPEAPDYALAQLTGYVSHAR